MNSVEKKPINMHFFQKILISIKDFEKYSLLMKESIGKTWLYIILLGFITSIALTLINIKPTLNRYEQLIAELKNNIQTLQYENDHLIVNDNSPTEVIHSDLFAGTLLIDTGEIIFTFLQCFKSNFSFVIGLYTSNFIIGIFISST